MGRLGKFSNSWKRSAGGMHCRVGCRPASKIEINEDPQGVMGLDEELTFKSCSNWMCHHLPDAAARSSSVKKAVSKRLRASRGSLPGIALP
ncbi:hypothetical protein Q31a_36940 [Aureliella helgolandensis]|uniref:Uncharacterized protein n=1 Tax=Aureliella helgolandensis TaxID=2527968 RepID=A0A518G9U1_9BACT|nr:hypothetical protein Q31a_36940 [Aureliella helgolandensis]